MKLKVALPLMLFSAIATAEEYRSISEAAYINSEAGNFEADQFSIGSTYFFGPKETMGPLKEFEYLNKTSNIFGGFANTEIQTGDFEFDNDTALIGGEYFAGNLLVGGSYQDSDDLDEYSATLGYLVNSDFLVSLDAVKVEDQDTEYFVNARYNHQLSGSDYIGFNFRTDDDFDTTSVSSKYFTQLAGETYLAVNAVFTDNEDADNDWLLGADYYFNKQTSLGFALQDDDVYALNASHFFNRNIAVNFAYSTSYDSDVDLDLYQLGLTAQF